MEDINLHFTGDFQCHRRSQQPLRPRIDNHIQQGQCSGIDPRQITWKRGGYERPSAGHRLRSGRQGQRRPREDGFDIVVASGDHGRSVPVHRPDRHEAASAKMVVAYSRAGKPITSHDLEAEGAMAALL